MKVEHRRESLRNNLHVEEMCLYTLSMCEEKSGMKQKAGTTG